MQFGEQTGSGHVNGISTRQMLGEKKITAKVLSSAPEDPCASASHRGNGKSYFLFADLLKG